VNFVSRRNNRFPPDHNRYVPVFRCTVLRSICQSFYRVVFLRRVRTWSARAPHRTRRQQSKMCARVFPSPASAAALRNYRYVGNRRTHATPVAVQRANVTVVTNGLPGNIGKTSLVNPRKKKRKTLRDLKPYRRAVGFSRRDRARVFDRIPLTARAGFTNRFSGTRVPAQCCRLVD